MTKNFFPKLRSNQGFTLIEILVVISIIGILIAISIFGLQGTFEGARDSRRKSDLKQFQNSLETFGAKNNSLFPARSSLATDATLCTDVGLTGCPTDPKTGSYSYCTDGAINTGAAGAQNYVLWATVENPASPVTYWIACSNGKTGAGTTVPTCGASFNCRLP